LKDWIWLLKDIENAIKKRNKSTHCGKLKLFTPLRMLGLTSQVTTEEHEATIGSLHEQIDQLTQQLDWFKRQLFGVKSEKRLDIDTSHQADLLSSLGVTPPPLKKTPTERISYERRKKQREANTVSDTGLRFDDSVPVETIDVSDPELKGVPVELLEQIGEKVIYRLGQRPSSHVVLK
jgi:transposase